MGTVTCPQSYSYFFMQQIENYSASLSICRPVALALNLAAFAVRRWTSSHCSIMEDMVSNFEDSVVLGRSPPGQRNMA